MVGDALQRERILENLDPDRLKECLEIAIENRAFDIDHLWKRTLVFWGFVVVLVSAVAITESTRPFLSAGLSAMGALFAYIWSLVNRGSKSWQESWEIKAAEYSEKLYGNRYIFHRAVKASGGPRLLSPLRYSVSKVLIALSNYVTVLLVGSAAYFLVTAFVWTGDINFSTRAILVVLFLVFTAGYGGYVWCCCKSGDKEITEV